MRILGLPGSVRAASHNAALLRAAAHHLPDGVELELFEGLKAIEPFDEDDEHLTLSGVHALREAIARADAVLIATPEYNSSIPGQLKNALDWASRPAGDGALKGKPVAVVGASIGLFGAVWAQAEARKVLKASGAVVVDEELPVGQADGAFSEDGRLAEPEHGEALAALILQLVERAQPVAAAA